MLRVSPRSSLPSLRRSACSSTTARRRRELVKRRNCPPPVLSPDFSAVGLDPLTADASNRVVSLTSPPLAISFPLRTATDAQPVHHSLRDERGADVFVGLAVLTDGNRW